MGSPLSRSRLKWYILLFIVGCVWSNCPSPQYLQLHMSGTITCNFDLGTYDVYWYYSDSEEYPFIRCEKDSFPAIYGPGYEDNSYRLDINGSLIVLNVTRKEDCTFKVLSFNRKDSTYEEVRVKVRTYENCAQEYPWIDICRGRSSCLISSGIIESLDCSFGCLNSAVELTWYIQYVGHRIIVKNKQGEEFKETLSISLSTSDINKHLKQPLGNFVCEARGIATDNRSLKSTVFIDNSTAWVNIASNDKNYQINNQVILPCGENNALSTYIWERITRNVTEVVAFVEDGRQHIRRSKPSWYFTDRGALVLSQVDLTDEGTYRCKFIDGETFGVYEQSVTVLVTPSPPFLLASGCPQTTEACVIKIESNITDVNLTCSVNEVYPQIFVEFENDYPSEIQLFDQTNKTNWNNERYSVIAFARLRLSESFSCNNDKFITCRATGTGALSMLNPEKEIKLSWEGCKEDWLTGVAFIIIAAAIFNLVLCCFVLILVRLKRKKKVYIRVAGRASF